MTLWIKFAMLAEHIKCDACYLYREHGLTKLDIAACIGFMMFATSSVVTPICLPEISQTLSTNLSEGGGMETARTFVVLVVLLLAGVSAQRWGKKTFLTLGQYLLAAGLLLMSFSQSYVTVIASLMVVGVGGGFSEALINPLVADAHPEDSGRYLNTTNAFYPIGVMASALFFGELLTLGYSWRLICRIAAGGALIAGIFFHSSRFPVPADERDSSFYSISSTLVMRGFWLFAIAIFLGAGVESAFTFWSRSYVQTYLQNVPRAGAIAVVLFAGAMALGRLFVARLSRKLSLKTILLCSALLGIVVSTMIPFASTLVRFYVLLALAGIAAACFWPTLLAEAASHLKVNATLLFVMLSCFGIAGFGATPWVMGIVGDSVGLRNAFWVVPGVFVGLVAVLGIIRKLTPVQTRKDAI